MPPVTEHSARALDDDEFAALIGALGPFGAAPRLAVGCSGGADSTALALLASRWAAARAGSLLALIVDHRLRRESATEAALALSRLRERGIAGRLLQIDGLRPGPALAERARDARYTALIGACRGAGIAHLLLGHHAADQGETVRMRQLAGSGAAGLAGMAALAERADIQLVRPLLGICPGRLRATLAAAGLTWVEDPSNRDPATLRARLRAEWDRGAGRTAAAAAARHGRQRAERDGAVGEALAGRAAIHPEGFAVIAPGPFAPAALGALMQAISGAPYPPSSRQIARLAANPRPATLGGVQLLPARRLGPGLLLVRERAALSPPVPAYPGARWDGRFRLGLAARAPAGTMIGALGGLAARLRRYSPLPSAIMHTLPALWLGDRLLAAPHIGYPDAAACREWPLGFCPRRPAAGAPWRGD